MVALLILMIMSGCGDSAPADPNAVPGQAEFGRYCAGCHGIDGQGRAPAFPPLAGSEWLDVPEAGLTAIVLLGLRGEIEVAGQRYAGYMPPMRHLDDAAIARVVAYVKQRWSEPEGDWTAADVAALRERLAGRGSLEGQQALDVLLEGGP
jgi:mono/diheme cytochrome c family protein